MTSASQMRTKIAASPLLHAIGVEATATYVATAPSMGYMEMHGIAAPPSYVTDLTFPVAYEAKLNLWQRTHNLMQYLVNIWRTYDFAVAESELFRRVHPSTPSLHELLMNLQFVFVNSRPLCYNPRVYSDKIKFVGGIHLRMSKTEPLSGEYVELLANSRPGGVVLFSLGSVVQMLNTPVHVRRSFFHALGQFTNHTVLWKHEQPELDAELAALYPNIILKKWIPQRELLKDPRVKAVSEVLNNPKYAENARRLAEMLNALPTIPFESLSNTWSSAPASPAGAN
ncbi:Glucuronosyltransferase [Aphelenchoides fujianensis]|nr:Glucuronosyltransferase [Aphelenchoides fujianensis]